MGRIAFQKQVEAAVNKHTGRLVSVHAIVLELQQTGNAINRETVRKWMVQMGCKPVGDRNGIYRVPSPRKGPSEGSEINEHSSPQSSTNSI